MREIKFRAWLEGTHDNLTFSEPTMDYNVTLSQEGFWCDVEGSWDIHGAYSTIPIMQFTGLHDKNGTPIYEGDILREEPKNDWEKTNYSSFEVFFHDGDANVDYNIGFTMGRMKCHGAIAGGYTPSFKPKTVNEMIVIGNIYENPDLI